MRRLFPRAMERIFGESDSRPSSSADGPHPPSDKSPSGQRPRSQQQQQQQQARQPNITVHDLPSSQPLIVESSNRDGGTQSLRCSQASLSLDEDGDEAHEFIAADPPPSPPMESLADALVASRAPDDTLGSPIHTALNKLRAHDASKGLRIRYTCHEALEPLDTRLWQKDVAKGCIDPDLLGTAARDFCQVEIAGFDRVLQLPCFMAHLASPHGLMDPGIDEAALGPLWADGTWTGTLVWDSAVHVCELLLSAPEAARVRGKTVLELGCGLGLPGLVCHALGASQVLLTDRLMVTSLVGEGLMLNSVPLSQARAIELEWSDEAAYSIKQEHLESEAPDLLIACDCIFQPLFGSAFLLLQMIQALAGPETIVILALERRKDDGAEAFFEQAGAAGFATELRLRRERVIVCEMRRT